MKYVVLYIPVQQFFVKLKQKTIGLAFHASPNASRGCLSVFNNSLQKMIGEIWRAIVLAQWWRTSCWVGHNNLLPEKKTDRNLACGSGEGYLSPADVIIKGPKWRWPTIKNKQVQTCDYHPDPTYINPRQNRQSFLNHPKCGKSQKNISKPAHIKSRYLWYSLILQSFLPFTRSPVITHVKNWKESIIKCFSLMTEQTAWFLLWRWSSSSDKSDIRWSFYTENDF